MAAAGRTKMIKTTTDKLAEVLDEFCPDLTQALVVHTGGRDWVVLYREKKPEVASK